MRKHKFISGEYYHIYNRGVDKRDIFMDKHDMSRFIRTVNEFMENEPAGSLRDSLKIHNRHSMSAEGRKSKKYASIAAYCLMPNHFHLLMKQNIEGGISKFMQRIGNGYSKYFNVRHDRSGSLFQGRFKSKHVTSDSYLGRLFVYINYNDQLDGDEIELSQSSLNNINGNSQLGIKIDATEVLDILDWENKKDALVKRELEHIKEVKRMKKQTLDV